MDELDIREEAKIDLHNEPACRRLPPVTNASPDSRMCQLHMRGPFNGARRGLTGRTWLLEPTRRGSPTSRPQLGENGVLVNQPLVR